MAPGAVGKSEAKTTVSPAAVREAALTLFAERGYHGTALSQIAAELKIRTPSLYNHMRAKQDLLRDIVADTTEQVWADYEQAVEGVDDVAERLRNATRVYALRHATHRREALIVNRDIASIEEPARSEVLELRRRHARAIKDLIEEGVKAGRFHEESSTLAAFGILEMCVSIARWFREDGPLSPEDVAEKYSEYALRVAGLG
ncbi:TetR/AcrR family transcriptional regulator [Amycolatopsis sp. FDAARGOS 1241]|uniref:TetR/AcrR family transcriptional regulator n=1 Tax=Amycolatopsis sp. FDAARGOS 1241 TaxID=2778070 RepID=UPI001950FE12|nr:TetR/AcrR family transcriptional regulator [Amycolatopsis sp. FDAARGOS 1241]QRP46328.1 TetR family transcriptional regulator [Amycolatopsis sp. FDAARGOS 1241]